MMLKMMRSDNKETYLEVITLCSSWHVSSDEVPTELSPAVGGRVCCEFKDTWSSRTLKNSFPRPSHGLHKNIES